MDWNTLWTATVAISLPVLRSVGGWAQKALADNKVTKYEWKKLAETIIRTLVISIFVYTGANTAGLDIGMIGSVAAAALADMLFGALKDNRKA